MEIQGVNTTRNDLFPFSALRVLGAMQIFLGAACLVLGVLDLALTMLSYDQQAARYAVSAQKKAEFETLVSMTVASAPVWCGTWYIVTGSLGTCVSRGRSHSLRFLKIAFLVLSVLCSAFFAPACTVLSCYIAVTRHTLDYGNLVWLMSTATTFLSLCEMGVAIVSAAVCCCCSPLRMAKVHILFADGDPNEAPKIPATRRKEEKFQNLRDKAMYKVPVKEATVQTEPQKLEPLPLPSTSLPPTLPLQQRRLAHSRYPILQRPSLTPEPEEFYPYSPRSDGYDRLKKWALPHDRLY